MCLIQSFVAPALIVFFLNNLRISWRSRRRKLHEVGVATATTTVEKVKEALSRAQSHVQKAAETMR